MNLRINFIGRALLCLFLFNNLAYANSEEIKSNDEILLVNKYKAPARISLGKTELILDKRLSKDFRLIDDASLITPKFILEDKKSYLWLFVQLPSKPNSFGKGYCGSGSEDYIYLLKLEAPKLKYVDRFMARSCLDNIDIDEGEDITTNNLPLVVSENVLEFSQTYYDVKKLRIRQVRLVPSPAQIRIIIKGEKVEKINNTTP